MGSLYGIHLCIVPLEIITPWVVKRSDANMHSQKRWALQLQYIYIYMYHQYPHILFTVKVHFRSDNGGILNVLAYFSAKSPKLRAVTYTAVQVVFILDKARIRVIRK